MIKLKNTIVIISILLIWSNLFSEVMHLKIKFFGITVVNVSMNDENQVLSIRAKSSALANIASQMDNSYTVNYTGDYIPKLYKKRIIQHKYEENREIIYDHRLGYATQKSKIVKKKIKYHIVPNTRDFFSALFFLRTEIDKKNKGSFNLDANKINWKAIWNIEKKEKIKTIFGKTKTIKIKLTFKKGKGKKERSDMLTNNLVNEEKTLYFWFTDNQEKIPVKAKFTGGTIFSVKWILDAYEK